MKIDFEYLINKASFVKGEKVLVSDVKKLCNQIPNDKELGMKLRAMSKKFITASERSLNSAAAKSENKWTTGK